LIIPQIVLSVIEESSGHLAGFADWQLRVMESVGEFERRRSACINVIRNNPPTWLDQTRFQACRTRELRDFIGLLGDFGTEFLKMGEGTVEMARKFIRDMALCAAR
jgi:hypothetical protein